MFNLTDGAGNVYTPEVLAEEAWEENLAEITLTSNGTARGGGSYLRGAPVSLSAEDPEGRAFLGWYEGGALVSKGTEYRFVAAADRTLEARFAPGCALLELSAAGGSASVRFSRGEGSAVLVAASYTAAGKMLDVAIRPLPAAGDSLSLPLRTDGAATVTAFLVDSQETMRPLCRTLDYHLP